MKTLPVIRTKHVMKAVLAYLKQKAESANSPGEAYASSREIIDAVQYEPRCVLNSLKILRDQKRIRMWPLRKPTLHKRLYADISLPEADLEAVMQLVRERLPAALHEQVTIQTPLQTAA